ncbi:MAG: (deoxy)nucleoside triphosphate pyrophosphohydrolase [Bacteroidetes bacterium]|nr:(deoxy)nucleoside triphosphate pyrophosphohydrolase [Bacteroidota bacterium]
MNKHYEVVAAIIINNGRILCVQRGPSKYDYISKKYEFPGGKMEAGETKEETIRREIFEELKMVIEVQEEFFTVTHHYPDFSITMHSFICNCENLNVTLTEHIDYKWLLKDELSNLDWAAADLPIVEKLINS